MNRVSDVRPIRSIGRTAVGQGMLAVRYLTYNLKVGVSEQAVVVGIPVIGIYGSGTNQC